MFRFFKNIINTVIVCLAVIGIFTLYKLGVFTGLTDGSFCLFSTNKDKIESEVGDFSKVDDEFNIDKAVKVMGYKTVIAKHPSSGQKMIIVDSGKKPLLTEEDIKGDGVKYKLEDLCKKVKYHSTGVQNIEITDKGYMTTYGQRVPYVKFNAKLSNFPHTTVSGIVSVVDHDKKNQRLIVSINDKKHYSQLITSEFYKNVKESKTAR